MSDSQAIFYFWAALRAEGWETTERVIVCASGDTWVVRAAKGGGQAVEGRAASPEAAWEAAFWKALGAALLRTPRAPPSAEAP
jgi:hypothetical protein